MTEQKHDPYAPSKVFEETSDGLKRERSIKRLKRAAGIIAILCLVVPHLGTSVAMFRAYNSIATGGSTPGSGEVGDSVERSLIWSMILIPVAIICTAIWSVCWTWLYRRERNSRGERDAVHSDQDSVE